jgi:hypothetical protein
MTRKNNNSSLGGIEPFRGGADENTEPEKEITIEPVNQEELSMLLSEPSGYAEIVKQIRKDTISGNKADQPNKTSKIPEYDLGKQMLAGYRKNTAARRKAPGQKAPIPIQSIPTPVPTKTASIIDAHEPETFDIQGEVIIRQIVARDIARLCRCNRA